MGWRDGADGVAPPPPSDCCGAPLACVVLREGSDSDCAPRSGPTAAAECPLHELCPAPLRNTEHHQEEKGHTHTHTHTHTYRHHFCSMLLTVLTKHGRARRRLRLGLPRAAQVYSYTATLPLSTPCTQSNVCSLSLSLSLCLSDFLLLFPS